MEAAAAALDISRGLPQHRGWCPRGSNTSYEVAAHLPLARLSQRWLNSGWLVEVLKIQRTFAQQPDLFPASMYPVRWYEPVLRHSIEVVWCESLIRLAERSSEGCLIYVFGTAQHDPTIDLLSHRLYRSCTIFAFDPAVRPHRFRARGLRDANTTLAVWRATRGGRVAVEFRPWGLRSANDGATAWRHKQYGQAFGALYTLGEIRAKLGHTGRRVALMKADCEGCEWGWLPAAAAELPYIDQLFVEFHLCAPSP